MKDFIGRIYESNNFGKFMILSEIFEDNSKDRLFKIKFINTGYETIATYSAIRHGSVKDYLYPSVAGIGYIGYLNTTVTDPNVIDLYSIWNDMINRCYNPNDSAYNFYGGIGVRVSPSWHNFSIFFNDVKELPGYYNKLRDPTGYQLDKDFMQQGVPKNKRIYSKYTCVWLSKFDNVLLMNRESINQSGYYGVIYKDGAYCTRINNKIYGRFTTPEAAANLFNYLYPKLNNSCINILNDVKYIPFEELSKYEIPKYKSVSSTTISEESTA